VITKSRPEVVLCSKDPILGKIISSQNDSWCDSPDPDPIWGLMGVVISQQISTKAALTIRSKVAASYPELVKSMPDRRITVERLRACGVSPRKAECCASIATNAGNIYQQIRSNGDLEETLLKIPGIGPWTVAIFRIFVLREPDILPVGDLGLERAITMHYSAGSELRLVSEDWKPYRSVACWYLWRSLGNPPLG
jgi:DNA-3-methyladenine glycosylase II